MDCAWDLLLLAALHALLLAAGGATVFLRFHLSASDWPRVARAAYADDVTALEVGMTVVGFATIALVLAGAGVARARNRALLLAEALFLLLVLAGTVFLAARALVVYGRAREWQRGDWDAARASDSELATAERFDALYCDAQLAFVCDHATLAQLLALGADSLSLLSGETGEIGGSASAAASGLCTGSSGDGVWDALCSVCSATVPSYASLSSLSGWIEDNCAYSAVSTEWCGNSTATERDATDGSPYTQCRAHMLKQAQGWAEALGIGWTAVCALLLMLLVFIALMIRSRAFANALDLEEAAEISQHVDRLAVEQDKAVRDDAKQRGPQELSA